jgi:rSAM/selenodomain-associated transferase 1
MAGAGPSHLASRASHAENALIIFAKAPVPGEVKTRLCPALTPDEAASLHGSFVLDAIERSKAIARGSSGPKGIDRFLACAPSSKHVFFRIMEERHGIHLVDQIGEGLGERMSQAASHAFSKGYHRVLLVGSDLPTLQPGVYAQALDLLERHDLVLGPAQDGGYYLLGLGRMAPELFVGIPWSTDQVLALTRRKAEQSGLTTALLTPCRDVDTLEDLQALIVEAGLAAGGRRRAEQQHVPNLSARTTDVLRVISERLNARAGKPTP